MNPFPSLQPRRYRSWHGWLLGAVLLLAVVLGLVQLFGEPEDHNDAPGLTWENIVVEERTDDSVTVPVGDEVPSADDGTTPVEAAPEEGAPVENDDAVLPATFNLAVPFSSQAPFGVWDPLHEDACEEASVYMIAEYFHGRAEGRVEPAVADEVITALVHYGEDELGHGLSISAAQTVDLINGYYDGAFTAEVVDDPTVEDIQRYLASGYPVIIPAAGRELGNPNFSGEGPLYHMLVLRGYDGTHFISNDPGTRLGEGYRYEYDVLMNAIADWTGSDIDKNAKRIVVMKPAA